jgi:hypothetical protein
VGALFGAWKGMEGIPEEWISQLANRDRIVQLGKSLGQLAVNSESIQKWSLSDFMEMEASPVVNKE